MKGTSQSKCKHQQEWEKLLKANQVPIYLGDHMTRTWVKGDKEIEEKGRDKRRSSLKNLTMAKIGDVEPQLFASKKIAPGMRCSRRKLSAGRRKINIGKEILTRHNITKKDILEWQSSFDALLSSSAGCYLFKLFLESEIADENLKFWLACEDLKNTKQKRVEKRIQDIFDTYINVYSPHEINIDYKMREDIVDQLKSKFDVSIFSEAQHQVYKLMHRDSYPRFLSSPIATELSKTLTDQGDGDDKSRKSRDESLSISGLMLCCYLRRWDNEDGIDDECSTTATHAGTSELCCEDNSRSSVSDVHFRMDTISNPLQTSVTVEHKVDDTSNVQCVQHGSQSL